MGFLSNKNWGGPIWQYLYLSHIPTKAGAILHWARPIINACKDYSNERILYKKFWNIKLIISTENIGGLYLAMGMEFE